MTPIVQVLEALLAAFGPVILDDIEAWVQGRKAASPTLAQEQKAIETAADVEAEAVLK